MGHTSETTGSTSARGSGMTQQQYDPAAQQMENLRLGQTQSYFDQLNQGGGMGQFARARPDLFGLSGQEQQFYNPLLTGGGQLQQTGTQLMTPAEQQAWQSSLNSLRTFSDPSRVQGYFSDVVAPQVRNDAIASGMGRSGGEQEIMARQGANLTQQMAALEPSLASATMAASAAPRAATQQALGMAAEPREMALQDYLRQQGQAQTMVSGIPFLPGQMGSQQQRQSGNQDSKTSGFNLLGSICWVADAIYGEGSPSARLARLWVSEGWQGRKADAFRAVYRRIGPRLASLIRRWPRLGAPLRPLFDSFVVKGWHYDEAAERMRARWQADPEASAARLRELVTRPISTSPDTDDHPWPGQYV